MPGRRHSELGEATVTLNAEELAVGAQGLFATKAKLTAPATESRGDADVLTHRPILDLAAESYHNAGSLGALNEGKRDRNRKAILLDPKVQMIQPTGGDSYQYLIRARLRNRQFCQLKVSRSPVGNQAQRLHGSIGSGYTTVCRVRSTVFTLDSDPTVLPLKFLK